MPNLYDVGAVGAGFVPGSGIMDMLGQAPAIGGGMGPSFIDNLKKQQYMDALLQLAGAAGDMAMVVPPVGLGIKGVATAGKTARAAGKTARAAGKATKAKAPAVITRPKTNYLENTPSFRDPRVGTRFDVEKLPGIAQRQPINFDEMLGGSLMTYPTDMLSRNTRIKSVSDIPLNVPVDSVGGLEYMMDLGNIANDIAYASNKGATTSQHNRVLRAAEENLARGGTGRVFVAPHTMAYGGENFSTTPTEGLLSLIDTIGPNKKLRDELDQMIREGTYKGVKGKFSDFVGLGDSGLRQQLMTGEGLSGGSAGDLRKMFVNKLSSKTAQKGMGFNYEDLQNAMLNPNVMYRPQTWMGDSVYEASRVLSPQAGFHPAYSHDLMGTFIGNSGGATVQDTMGSLFERLLQGEMGKPGDSFRHTTGKLSTAGSGVSLFLDENEIARLKRLWGQ